MARTARARPTREEDNQAQRRRRQPGTIDRMDELTLAIPDAVSEANPDHTFRWALDNPKRIHGLTVKDDWDVVEGVDPIPDHTSKAGKQVSLVLLKKRKDYWEEDQATKAAALKEQERALLRARKTDTADDRSDDVSYVPEGNRISNSTGFTP